MSFRTLILAAAIIAPTIAAAAEPSAPPPTPAANPVQPSAPPHAAAAPGAPSAANGPEMVIMPRELIEVARNWIASPDATSAVRIYALITACLADNPSHGVIVHNGPDQCSAVTDAVNEADKLKADAKAKAESDKK